MQDAPIQPLVVWRLMDGKPGHESQTLGLVNALKRLAAEQGFAEPRCIDMPLGDYPYTLWDWLFKRFRPGFLQPRPDFIIGAGHRTHWPMLCARRSVGGKAIALMSPTLPSWCFDWVVAPAHDGLTGRNVIVTQGVLNAMQPAAVKRPGYTVVMVGGVSKHFLWDDTQVLAQLEQIMARHPQVRLTDSRRTPAALRTTLAARWPVEYQPWEQCPPGWLASELAIAENAWVTEDSVSMIYEALTAGCAVGLVGLQRPEGKPGRLVRGVEGLLKNGLLCKHPGALVSQTINRTVLAEARRVAYVIWGTRT
ncbi:mitochondrial fission ELM1 family protein [Perlucidibaca aquatica]|uniref:mitochondrial fission ELM1 family protein n=1 Tax=Perlucidibaca aquatica TaxID=1852776 RepID=UPI00083B6821|nr:ELM1/GtrOC1 family putative glycosyltransferase [Perlucidibaca aquatica]